MPEKILFSPIGGTDPIKYFNDGSMLHICRNYRPDVVYLYLSQEMLEYHRKDNRYVNSIEWLGDYLGHSFEVRIIERPELDKVHQYDIFYWDFREEIGKIVKEMKPGDELLLNISSGTPAMKSALLVMATVAEYRFRTIQVASPLKKMNKEYEERDDYDGEANWELNEDNAENAENRCEEVKCQGLMRMLKIAAIKKHVLAYDYTAALAVASEMEYDISEDAHAMLKIADARIKLNLKKVSELMKNRSFEIFPIREGNKQKIFEYALVLQTKIVKEEYADFLRGITPLIVDVLELILKRVCGIKLEDCCQRDKKTEAFRWDDSRLEQLGLLKVLEAAYKKRGGFKAGVVYSSHIGMIIQKKSKDVELNKNVAEIVEVEGKLRNVVAHEIISVTEKWFLDETGKNARQIFELIKFLIRAAGINAKKEDWQSYDIMNNSIIAYLDELV